MSEAVQFLPDGTVTTPQGFVAGATYAGIKTYSEDKLKLDLGLLRSQEPCVTVGTFTTNKVQSPSLVLTRKLVEGGKVRGVVATSGIANTCVGEQGMIDAKETASLAAQQVGVGTEEMAICSTGIIGVELPMALIRSGVPKLTLAPDGGLSFARAIMTTDRRPKSMAVQCELDGRTVTIGGCVKGSGMIHPNMATLLAFLTTDAAAHPDYLRETFRGVVHETFNMVTIDGDGSTNDTALLFANGAAGNTPLVAKSPSAARFEEALASLCNQLTKELVRDARGFLQDLLRPRQRRPHPGGRPPGRPGHRQLQPGQERHPRQRPELGARYRGGGPERRRPSGGADRVLHQRRGHHGGGQAHSLSQRRRRSAHEKPGVSPHCGAQPGRGLGHRLGLRADRGIRHLQ